MNRYDAIPLEELKTPKDHHVVLCGKYWIVDNQDRALIYTKRGAYSPQYYENLKTAKMILRKLEGPSRPHDRVVWGRHTYLDLENYR